MRARLVTGRLARAILATTIATVTACTVFDGLTVPEAGVGTGPVDASLDVAARGDVATGDHSQADGTDAGARDDRPEDGSAADRASDAGQNDASPDACTGKGEYFDETVNKHCYQYTPGLYSWDQAKSGCTAWGGYLVVITESDEYAFVSTIVNAELGLDSGGANVWIGLSREDGGVVSKETGFAWVDSEPFCFEHWGDVDPSDAAGKDCVVQYGMGLGGNWDNFECKVTTGYNCERNEL